MNTTALTRYLGANIRNRRRERSLTQAQLAEKAGVSERLVRSLEKGTASGISLDNLNAVLEALGLELALAEFTPPSQSSDNSEYEAALHQQLARFGYAAVEVSHNEH